MSVFHDLCSLCWKFCETISIVSECTTNTSHVLDVWAFSLFSVQKGLATNRRRLKLLWHVMLFITFTQSESGCRKWTRKISLLFIYACVHFPLLWLSYALLAHTKDYSTTTERILPMDIYGKAVKFQPFIKNLLVIIQYLCWSFLKLTALDCESNINHSGMWIQVRQRLAVSGAP